MSYKKRTINFLTNIIIIKFNLPSYNKMSDLSIVILFLIFWYCVLEKTDAPADEKWWGNKISKNWNGMKIQQVNQYLAQLGEYRKSRSCYKWSNKRSLTFFSYIGKPLIFHQVLCHKLLTLCEKNTRGEILLCQREVAPWMYPQRDEKCSIW